MSRLIVENLSPLHNVEFETKQFNILIGQQGVGKSTICKAIYFFRLLKSNIVEYLYDISINGEREKNSHFPQALNSKNKELFVLLFGYTWDMPENLKFSYEYTDKIIIDVLLNKKNNKNYLEIKFNSQLLKKIRELKDEALNNHKKQNIYSISLNINNMLRENISKVVNSIFGDDELPTYYIPAGRSLLTLLTNQKTRLSYDNIDLVTRYFMNLIEIFSPNFNSGIQNLAKFYPKNERKFDPNLIANDIIKNLKGEYFNEGQREYLKVGDDNVLINYISSGQQEALWVLNLLYVWLLKDEKNFIIIEEPEAHLYPTMQKYLLDFICYFMNITGSTVIITTHSPYMLTNSNLLYYAGALKLKNINSEKVTGKYKYINPKNSNIYKISIDNKNNTIKEDLKVKDENDIKSELIDDVSDIINNQYTKLIDLES